MGKIFLRFRLSEAKVHKVGLSEFFFLLSGFGLLVSLPWLGGAGFFVWLTAKAFYLTGVIFLIFKK